MGTLAFYLVSHCLLYRLPLLKVKNQLTSFMGIETKHNFKISLIPYFVSEFNAYGAGCLSNVHRNMEFS